MIKHVSANEIKDLMSKDFTIVNVHAKWCGPCKMMGPSLEEMGKENDAQFDILRIDVDENKEFAEENNIKGVPVTYIYKKHERIATLNGYASKEMILDKIK